MSTRGIQYGDFTSLAISRLNGAARFSRSVCKGKAAPLWTKSNMIDRADFKLRVACLKKVWTSVRSVGSNIHKFLVRGCCVFGESRGCEVCCEKPNYADLTRRISSSKPSGRVGPVLDPLPLGQIFLDFSNALVLKGGDMCCCFLLKFFRPEDYPVV